MNLEEIINAAVEKRINDMLARFFDGKEYSGLECEIRQRMLEITKQEFAKRQAEVSSKIAAAVADFEPASFEVNAYVNIKTK